MPLYEVLLIEDDQHSELRLTDQPLRVGAQVTIAHQRWLVEREARPEEESAETRYICVRAEEKGTLEEGPPVAPLA
jgi:hypothetical protein